MTGEATVHLVDDDESYRKATARLLALEGFRVSAYASGGQLLSSVAPSTRGCVIADLDMPEFDGLALQSAMARAEILMPVVFLSGHGDIPSTVLAMQGGALDFLEKHAPREKLVSAVRLALERDSREHEYRARRDNLRQRFASLTIREREVLREVVRGQMNKQIAATLGIRERTVKLHRTAIKSKVGVHSTAELATLVREAEITDDRPTRGDT